MSESNPDYKVFEYPFGTRRRLRVVCCGAGFSGILSSILYKRILSKLNVEFICYEKNESIGGTWFENKYCGAACDIPSYNYHFSFDAEDAGYTSYYATAAQILQYLKKTVAKYEIEEYIKLKHKITHAVWLEETKEWELKVQDADGVEYTDKCHIFINATGLLNKWRWPAIPGLEDFKGKLMHSAAWDTEYDFEGKNVAVIGIGSSAIQIVPQLQPIVSHLTSFIRSPSWIIPTHGFAEPSPNDPKLYPDLSYHEDEIERFKNDREYLLAHRRAIHDEFSKQFHRTYKHSEVQRKAKEMVTAVMKDRLKSHPELIDKIVPTFAIGCRRSTPGIGFLESLVQPNAKVVTDNIKRFTADGIETVDGTLYKFDAIVCATGFDTTFRPKFPLLGRNGVDLVDYWTTHHPEAYFGMSVPGFPNYLMYAGPAYPVAAGTLLGSLQAQGDYFVKLISKMQVEGITAIQPSVAAVNDLADHNQEFHKNMVWTSHCKSWYKSPQFGNKVTAVYPGSAFHYYMALRNPRWEDWEYEYAEDRGRGHNRFAYLGNGFHIHGNDFLPPCVRSLISQRRSARWIVLLHTYTLVRRLSEH